MQCCVSDPSSTIGPMYIPKLNYPGLHLAIEDEAAEQQMRGLTYLCDNSFIHAAIALEGYKRSCREQTNEAHADWPHEYRRELPEFYARSFVAALFDIEKGVVGYCGGMSLSTDPAVKGKWQDAFHGLKDVRDSDSHADERSRGLARGKPIESEGMEVTLPIDGVFRYTEHNNMFRVWVGDRYGRTAADGRLAEIEISEAKLATARDIYQEVIDALPWRRGLRRTSPEG